MKFLRLALFSLVGLVVAQNEAPKSANSTSNVLSSSSNSTGSAAVVPPSMCTSYPSSGICSKYINYQVFTKGAPVAMIEKQLGLLANLSLGMGQVAPTCVDAYYRYACSFAYPKCGENGGAPTMGCKSSCENTLRTCKNIFILTGKGTLPDCNQKSPLTGKPLSSESTCNDIKPQVPDPNAEYNLSAVKSGYTMADCPPPFIKDPNTNTVTSNKNALNNIYCRSGCCIPCPAQNYFYPEHWAERGFMATDIIRATSSITGLFMLVSYLVLPDKRRHPSLIILNLCIGIFLFSVVVFFSIGNPKRLQCANPITVSTQSNNMLCAVQGTMLVFSSMATCCWVSVLIINLHMHTVWNANIFVNRYWILNVICWGVPAIMSAIALGLHQIKFEFANLCLISVDHIFEIFFYPMAVAVCPAAIIHVSTFVYITKVALQEGARTDNATTGRKHKHVLAAVQIQWRALLLAIVASGTVVFYWIFYFTQIHRVVTLERDQAITQRWLQCMVSPFGNQNDCVVYLRDHLPPYGLMLAAESLVSSIGIFLFIIFGKRSLWREWNDLIYDWRIRFFSGSRSEKNGDQFYAL